MTRRSESSWQEAIHLLAAVEALHAAFERSAAPAAHRYAAALETGMLEARQLLAAGPETQWPPGFLSGLRQGGREILKMAAKLPSDEQPRSIDEIQAAGGPWLESLVSGTPRRALQILRRGQIRSEDEYDCVRAHVDQLEARAAPKDELARYWTLIDAFSAGG